MNKLLELGNEKKPKQKLQPIQAYSCLRWQSHLRDIIEPMWNAQLVADPILTKRDRLAFRNKMLKEMLEKESPAVRQEVEEFRHLHHSASLGKEKEKELLTIKNSNDDDLSLDERERLRRKKAEEIQL